MLERQETYIIKYSNQDCSKLDKNVEKNIIDFFNEDIIDTKEITEKKSFGTELVYNFKNIQSVFDNVENNYLNNNSKKESKDNFSKLNLDDLNYKKVFKSCREQTKEIEQEKLEKKLIRTEPNANTLSKASSEEKCKLNEGEFFNSNNNNMFSLGYDTTSESKFFFLL